MGKTQPQGQLKESTIQEQIIEAFSLLAHKNNFMFFSVPNERVFTGTKGQQIARLKKLKRMGLMPGVADLCILKGGAAYFLEVKTATGKQSNLQLIFMERAVLAGCRYLVVRSMQEALSALKYWKIIT